MLPVGQTNYILTYYFWQRRLGYYTVFYRCSLVLLDYGKCIKYFFVLIKVTFSRKNGVFKFISKETMPYILLKTVIYMFYILYELNLNFYFKFKKYF